MASLRVYLNSFAAFQSLSGISKHSNCPVRFLPKSLNGARELKNAACWKS